jgi:hypothetical protein
MCRKPHSRATVATVTDPDVEVAEGPEAPAERVAPAEDDVLGAVHVLEQADRVTSAGAGAVRQSSGVQALSEPRCVVGCCGRAPHLDRVHDLFRVTRWSHPLHLRHFECPRDSIGTGRG